MKLYFHQDGDSLDPEMLRAYTAEGYCPLCHQLVKFPVSGPEDEPSQATYWEENYNRLLGALNDTIKDIDAKYGINPAMVMWGDQLKRLRDMAAEMRRRKEEAEG